MSEPFRVYEPRPLHCDTDPGGYEADDKTLWVVDVVGEPYETPEGMEVERRLYTASEKAWDYYWANVGVEQEPSQAVEGP